MQSNFRLRYLPHYLAKSYNYFLFRDSLILVYTMGKVGSTTVYRTIKNEFPLNKVHHVHYLSDYFLNEVLPVTSRNEQISLGRRVNADMNKSLSHRVKVISVVRDPIAMSLSHLFEVPDDFTREADITRLTVDELLNVFKGFDHEYPLTWFDREFLQRTGVNVYDLPFNRSEPYAIYNLEKFDLLIFKLESLNSHLLPGLEKFLAYKFPAIIKSNETKIKGKGSLQSKIREEWRGDVDSLERIYNSKYCRHFYSEGELQQFKSYWLRS